VRRGSIVQLVVFGLVAAGLALIVAFSFQWLPRPASHEAGRINFLFWFVTIICIAIFALVVAVIVYSVLKFRVAPDDDTDGPPIHGHTGLEVVWTAIPAILVIAIGIISAVILGRDDAAGKNPLNVDVIAQQFAWSFKYPDHGGITSAELQLPKGRSVLLHLTTRDVIHSFWVPEFSQKQDAVPGITTTLHITPDKLGTYPVICTELCGLGHALMRSAVHVMTKNDFKAWLDNQGSAAASGNPAQAGKAVFTANGCGSCHTLRDAGVTAKIGPDLDKLPAEAQRAGKPLADFVKESIVDPNKYVEKGYPANVMPPSFGTSLSSSQLSSLVQYLISASKGGGA
jgi:cytochrome c oxidase subunit 2